MMWPTVIRGLVMWILLSVRDALFSGRHGRWTLDLGLALLVATVQWLVIDWPEDPLPPLLRFTEAGIAAFAMLLVGFHYIKLPMPPTDAIGWAIAAALVAGLTERMVISQFPHVGST